ncbi:MAG TPA: hypothetical protein VNF02_04375 [Candidatus Limnocylindrales bacterium]|nr:hypothetical protein [Candidatus Limnocylindrales bacterium]
MKRLAIAACAIALLSLPAWSGGPEIPQVRVAAGSVLNFQMQTRLKSSRADAMDQFPAGTVMRVKVAQSINSARDADGTAFRGTLVAPLVSPAASGKRMIVPADAQVNGLLVLLRSREHPQGFRYDLLITKISDGGKSYPVTASLSSSLYDPAEPRAPKHSR